MVRKIIHGCSLELIVGDVTDQAVDAIVNAANQHLAGGGGVDGAIHRRGGPEIMDETRRRYPNGCPTGSAVPSGAGTLPAKYVFHAVGPVWQGGGHGEAELLKSAYQTCLRLAGELRCDSLAFPSLSTGAYRFPLHEASRIALDTHVRHLQEHGFPHLVRFVLFDSAAFDEFSRAMDELSID